MSATLLEIKRLLVCNNIPEHRIYEYVACYEHETIPWSLLPSCERKGFKTDLGIDGWNPETKKAIQVKYYSGKSKISLHCLGTFHMFAHRMGAKEICLVAPDEKFLSGRVLNVCLSGENPLMKFESYPQDNYKAFLENLEIVDLDDIETPKFDDGENEEIIEVYSDKEDDVVDDEDDEEEDEEVEIEEDENDKEIYNSGNVIDHSDIQLKSYLKPRSYQRRCIRKFMESDKEDYRIRMATGLGKSLIIREISYKFERVCIVVPLRTILRELASYFDPAETQLIGTGYNQDLDLSKRFIIVIENSVDYVSDLEFDLVIYDEAHHVYKKGRNIKAKRYLNLSATLKGEVDLDYGLNWGIEKGHLSDYNLELILHKGDTHSALVRTINEKIEYLRILGFCNNMKSLLHVESLLKAEDISYGIIVGKTKNSERLEIIEKFRNLEIRVILSIRCIGEGVNIPEAATCIFFDGISDSIQSIQRIGRVLRKSDLKDKAFVVAGVNVEEDSENMMLYKFIKTLNKFNGDEDFLKSGRINMSYLLSEGEEREDEKYGEYFEILENNIYESIRDGWDIKYQYLAKFINGNKKVPSQYSKNDDEKSIGMWMCNQKASYRNNKMSQERISKLESIDGWNWKVDFEKKWDDKKLWVLNFVKNTGKRPGSLNLEEKKYGQWLCHEITKIKSERYRNKYPDRSGKIKEILSYCPEYEKDIIWNNNYKLTLDFVKNKKDRPKARSENESEKKIGIWLAIQCRTETIEKYKIENPEKNKKIKEILSYCPETNIDKIWDNNYNLIKDFVINRKKRPLKNSKDDTEKKLGSWLSFQYHLLQSKTYRENNPYKVKKVEKIFNRLGTPLIYEDFIVDYDNLEKLTLAQLRDVCHEKNIEKISAKNKSQLIELIKLNHEANT